MRLFVCLIYTKTITIPCGIRNDNMKLCTVSLLPRLFSAHTTLHTIGSDIFFHTLGVVCTHLHTKYKKKLNKNFSNDDNDHEDKRNKHEHQCAYVWCCVVYNMEAGIPYSRPCLIHIL
jgi:hypothetical protein